MKSIVLLLLRMLRAVNDLATWTLGCDNEKIGAMLSGKFILIMSSVQTREREGLDK